MRRQFLAVALLVFTALEGKALAQEPASLVETAPETNAMPVTSPRRKPDLPSRAGPIVLIAVGGATTFVAGGLLLLVGAEGGGGCEEAMNCKTPDLTGFAVATGVGVTALITGIVWLVDVNHRRHVLERRAWNAAGRPVVIPVYEPTTRTAALTWSQQF